MCYIKEPFTFSATMLCLINQTNKKRRAYLGYKRNIVTLLDAQNLYQKCYSYNLISGNIWADVLAGLGHPRRFGLLHKNENPHPYRRRFPAQTLLFSGTTII